MAFCTQCGNSFNESDQFCNKCGREAGVPSATYENSQSGTKSNLAMWAHLGPLLVLASTFVFGFTGVGAFFGLFAWLPALLIMNNQNADAFTKEHARESLNFQLFWLVAGIVLVLGGFTFALATLGIGLIFLIPLGIGIGIFQLVVMIQAISAANVGNTYRYPAVLFKFVK